MKVKFYKPYVTGNEMKYIKDLLDNRRDLSGDGIYTKKVHKFFEEKYDVPKVLLTTSGTTALEFAVRLLNLKRGDEVIVPSFTFSSTVNAVLVSSNAKPVFADIDPYTLNIDPVDIVEKITKKTKAIIVVHYAGVACDMDKIMKIAKKYKLKVIEDAAQAIEAKYKHKYLGTIGDFGCFSFHDTKNITCGEGGAIFINTKDQKIIEQAEIIREKGTNRTQFFQGQVDKYTWMDVGSSYLPSDILAAFLLAQLEQVEEITKKRVEIYNFYKDRLKQHQEKGLLKVPQVPDYATHNGHIFYVLMNSEEIRNKVLSYLRKNNVEASFHYIPLHSAPFGQKLVGKKQNLEITEIVSKCMIRLPIFPDMNDSELDYVMRTFDTAIKNVFESSKKPARVKGTNFLFPIISKEAKYEK